jgi:hypothetical protein
MLFCSRPRNATGRAKISFFDSGRAVLVVSKNAQKCTFGVPRAVMEVNEYGMLSVRLENIKKQGMEARPSNAIPSRLVVLSLARVWRETNP